MLDMPGGLMMQTRASAGTKHFTTWQPPGSLTTRDSQAPAGTPGRRPVRNAHLFGQHAEALLGADELVRLPQQRVERLAGAPSRARVPVWSTECKMSVLGGV